jgi:hypothetical protein
MSKGKDITQLNKSQGNGTLVRATAYLIELVNAADATVCEHQGAALQ